MKEEIKEEIKAKAKKINLIISNNLYLVNKEIYKIYLFIIFQIIFYILKFKFIHIFFLIFLI
jgi:hypothetical protein